MTVRQIFLDLPLIQEDRAASLKAWETRRRAKGKKVEPKEPTEAEHKKQQAAAHKQKFEKHKTYIESLDNAGLEVTKQDAPFSDMFAVKLKGSSSENEYRVDPSIDTMRVKNTMKTIEKQMPQGWRSDFWMFSERAVDKGEVGGRKFTSAGSFSATGISIYPGGHKEDVISHEIAHMIYDGLADMEDETIDSTIDFFNDEIDQMKTPTGITTYMDEYLDAGNSRRYTEVFAAIAQKDSNRVSGKDWRKASSMQKFDTLFEMYDDLRKHSEDLV